MKKLSILIMGLILTGSSYAITYNYAIQEQQKTEKKEDKKDEKKVIKKVPEKKKAEKKDDKAAK
jgi:hypothetical protein